MHYAEEPSDDPFHDCELDSEMILGTQVEDVLFTDDTKTTTKRNESRPHTRTLRVLGMSVVGVGRSGSTETYVRSYPTEAN